VNRRFTRKWLIIISLFVSLASVQVFAYDDDELTLFDSGGNPVAYIDTADDDLTIYLWDGTPVAYLYSEDRTFHVYGFNGNHLGWFVNGIMRDSDGYAVGATEKSFSGITKIEPIKSIKRIKPIQNIRRIAPIAPIFKNSWSRTNLRLFLRAGAK